MKLLKASDLEVISGAWGKRGGDCEVFYPVDIQVSWWKIASGEDLEPFHSVADKGGLWTETDYFVALKHPDGKKKIIT